MKKITKLERLPKVIEYNDDVYALDLHITFKNKVCLCYKNMFHPDVTDTWFILSQVVEPGMESKVDTTKGIEQIVDVPTFTAAVNTITKRINYAVKNNIIKVRYR